MKLKLMKLERSNIRKFENFQINFQIERVIEFYTYDSRNSLAFFAREGIFDEAHIVRKYLSPRFPRERALRFSNLSSNRRLSLFEINFYVIWNFPRGQTRQTSVVPSFFPVSYHRFIPQDFAVHINVARKIKPPSCSLKAFVSTRATLLTFDFQERARSSSSFLSPPWAHLDIGA